MDSFTQPDKDLKSAATEGDPVAVKDALERGGDPDKVNMFGGTAFNNAIKSKNIECVRMMIEAGAEVNLQAGSMHSCPLSHARTCGTAEIVSLLEAAGARLPEKREPKQLERKATVQLVDDGDTQMNWNGFHGLILNNSVEFVYDFRNCLLAIGAKKRAAAVTHFIATIEELGPRPSEKRALAFIGRHPQHFAKIDAKYLDVRENLDKLCEEYLLHDPSA
jgi:ankyrin repeat protein